MARNCIAFNVELPQGGAPEWVELIPRGPAINGRDGRRWVFDRPEDVVNAFRGHGAPLPIDWEHASETRAPNGEEAPAAGWITELEARDGALWGRVEWTERAAGQIERREYRFLSPVFLYTKNERRIMRMVSAGLTNLPNLRLAALNRINTQHLPEEEDMDLKDLLQALGLPEGASVDEAVTAANAMKAELEGARASTTKITEALGVNKQASPDDLVTAVNGLKAASEKTPALDRYVPRPDYDAAMQRASNAEAKLREAETATREAKIEEAVQAALKAGKITPATVEYHRGVCRQEGGLAQFEAFVKAAPAIGDPVPEVEGRAKNTEGAKLSDEELAVCRQLGMSEEDFLKNKEVA